MKKFKKLLKKGNPQKIKKFVQKKMDKIERLEFQLEELSNYTFQLEQNYYDLDNDNLSEETKSSECVKNGEINEDMKEKKSCCDENCCDENCCKEN